MNYSLICGQCHYAMDGSVSKNSFPVEYRVRCHNPRCENFGKVFRVDTAAALKLIEITDQVVAEMESK